jgi:hypothetical protein
LSCRRQASVKSSSESTPRRIDDHLRIAKFAFAKKIVISTENFISGGVFLSPQNSHPKHHVYHAKHHKFTTKNHALHHVFSKTPLKTPAKTAKPRIAPGLHFFS